MSAIPLRAIRTSALDGVEIREASGADNAGLLALTRKAPMTGTIALRIDRDPDFFAVLRQRGEAVVFVAAWQGELIGCVSAAVQDVYIDGAREPVAYVGDLKVLPRFTGTRVALRLLGALRAWLDRRKIDLVTCVAAEGNEAVLPMLAGRLGIPPFVPAGRFVVHELVGLPFARSASPYVVDTAQPDDATQIDDLLERFHRSRQFAPHASGRDHGDAIATVVARHGSTVVATLELSDPSALKQNVLLGAPLATRALLAPLRAASRLLGGPPLPRIGQPIRMGYLRRLACDEAHPDALRPLLQWARRAALRHRFAFAAVALHERDPLTASLRGIPRFRFNSLLYVTSLRGSEKLDAVAAGIPFEDYALV